MHFTLSLFVLLAVLQVLVALPTPSSTLDAPAVFTRRSDQQTGVDSNTVKEKCLGGLGMGGLGMGGMWGAGGFPFTQGLFGGLMGQFGMGGVCSPFMGAGFGWGQCNVIAACPGAFNIFQNQFLPGLQGLGFGGNRAVVSVSVLESVASVVEPSLA
ncbi:secreted protein [Melampsora americana]|nr:secreted protein [Melampsora americana]